MYVMRWVHGTRQDLHRSLHVYCMPWRRAKSLCRLICSLNLAMNSSAFLSTSSSLYGAAFDASIRSFSSPTPPSVGSLAEAVKQSPRTDDLSVLSDDTVIPSDPPSASSSHSSATSPPPSLNVSSQGVHGWW
jgi:hypothetical protein